MKLTIAVDTDWLTEPAIQELTAKGYTVVSFVSTGFDLVLSAKAWNWNASMWPYLDVALKAARKENPKEVKKNARVSKPRGTVRAGGRKTGRRRRNVSDLSALSARTGRTGAEQAGPASSDSTKTLCPVH